MKYTEAVEYLEALPDGEGISGKASLKVLCEKFKNPQDTLSFLCIEGADASVTAYTAAVLKAAGYKVGCYMPSAAMEYRERFLVGGRSISQKALIELTEEMQKICEDVVTEGYPHPTASEVEGVLAFAYFKKQNCELVLFCSNLIRTIAEDKVSFVSAGEHPSAEKIKYGLEKQRFDYGGWKKLEILNAGVEQVESAVQAVEILLQLKKQEFLISEAAMRKGLLQAKCPGKFTLVGKKPYFIVDEAYDLCAAVKLSDSIKQYFADKRIVFIMSALRESDCEKIINVTHNFADWIITVAVPGKETTMSSYELAAEVAKVHPNVTAVDSLEEAVEIGRLLTQKEDVILAFGSPNIFKELCRIMSTQPGK